MDIRKETIEGTTVLLASRPRRQQFGARGRGRPAAAVRRRPAGAGRLRRTELHLQRRPARAAARRPAQQGHRPAAVARRHEQAGRRGVQDQRLRQTVPRSTPTAPRRLRRARADDQGRLLVPLVAAPHPPFGRLLPVEKGERAIGAARTVASQPPTGLSGHGETAAPRADEVQRDGQSGQTAGMIRRCCRPLLHRHAFQPHQAVGDRLEARHFLLRREERL